MRKRFLFILFALCFFKSSSADTLTIAMTGDIMMGTTYPSVMLPEKNGTELFLDAKPILKNADLALGNLEGAICDGGKSTKGTGKNSYSFNIFTVETAVFCEELQTVFIKRVMACCNLHTCDAVQIYSCHKHSRSRSITAVIDFITVLP